MATELSSIDGLWRNARIAAMTPNRAYGMIEKGALAVSEDRIAWVGAETALPADVAGQAARIVDVGGKLITPGLVDCHSHLVYAGSRADEFEMRLKGVSYEDIARRGGGILSTLRATRAADEKALFAQSAKRLLSFLREGVTTMEIKSGYGLDLETECRQLAVAGALDETYPVRIVRTFLGAHTVPPEYKGREDRYIDFVCDEVIPVIAEKKLASAVDVFCESIAMNLKQTEKVLNAAHRFGLSTKMHAEQLSYMGSVFLAAKYKALSVDHLEYATAGEAAVMKKNGMTGVLLPGAFYFIRETRLPPVDLLRNYQIPIALASDANPGTSPTGSLLLMLNMGCTLFGLTPEEALAGITRNGAKALGLDQDIGTLEEGKAADFVVWDVQNPAELAYRFGDNPMRCVVKDGRVVRQSSKPEAKGGVW